MNIEFCAWKGPERTLGNKIQRVERRRVGLGHARWTYGVLFLVNSFFVIAMDAVACLDQCQLPFTSYVASSVLVLNS